MSTKNAKNLKVMLGVITVTSLSALTLPANAETLHKSASVENLLSQARISLDTTTQQIDKSSGVASLEKLESSAAIGTKKGSNCGCDSGNCSCKDK